MPLKFRELLARLQADGWVQIGQKGSHQQFRHALKPGRVTVSGKPGDDVPHGLHKSILRQAGLKR